MKVVDSPPGITSPSSPQLLGLAHLDGPAPSRRSISRVLAEVSLHGENADPNGSMRVMVSARCVVTCG